MLTNSRNFLTWNRTSGWKTYWQNNRNRSDFPKVSYFIRFQYRTGEQTSTHPASHSSFSRAPGNQQTLSSWFRNEFRGPSLHLVWSRFMDTGPGQKFGPQRYRFQSQRGPEIDTPRAREGQNLSRGIPI